VSSLIVLSSSTGSVPISRSAQDYVVYNKDNMANAGESSTGSRPVNTKLPPVFSRTQADGRLKGDFTKEDIEDFRKACESIGDMFSLGS